MMQGVSVLLRPLVWLASILLRGETIPIYPRMSRWTLVLLPFLAVRDNDIVPKAKILISLGFICKNGHSESCG